MTNFTIEVDDQAAQAALNRLAQKFSDAQPVLQAVGDGIMERTKDRFDASQGPDGTPWKENKPSTVAAWLGKGKTYRNKSGDLNAAGLRKWVAKKPLIGKSGDLSRQFVVQAGSNEVVVGSTMVYAAIHQFGGRTSPHVIRPRYKQALAFNGIVRKSVQHPGSDIPARPFLPVRQDGTLYPQERAAIIADVNALLDLE